MSVARLEVGEAFQQIEAVKRIFSNLQGRVDLGIINTEEGRSFHAVIDVFEYQARMIEDPTQPRVLRWNKDRVLGVKELPGTGGSSRSGYLPIAYEADLVELPPGLPEALINHLNRFQPRWNA